MVDQSTSVILTCIPVSVVKGQAVVKTNISGFKRNANGIFGRVSDLKCAIDGLVATNGQNPMSVRSGMNCMQPVYVNISYRQQQVRQEVRAKRRQYQNLDASVDHLCRWLKIN